MLGLNDFLVQILQPYFFYSIVFLSIAFVCIEVFLKLNPLLSRKNQSIIWLIPLLTSLIVFIFFNPQTILPSSGFQSMFIVTAKSSYALFWNSSASTLSITGSLCLSAIVASAGYLVFTLAFGKRIVMRNLHVFRMAPGEYAALQEKVKEIAHKIGISEPKVGLIEDLRPNAFTVGYGRDVVIVFSLGILEMLNIDELTAVASHELAHVKSRDYLFRSILNSLTILSFFNPLSYFAATKAQRERELLADEKGAALLDQPKLMANVLAKLESAIQEFPKARFAERLSASLFLMSSLANRHSRGILSMHPAIANRVHNINTVISKTYAKPRRRTASLLLVAILVATAILSGYTAVQAQTSFSAKNNKYISDNQSANQNLTSENGGHLPANLSNLTSLTTQEQNLTAGNKIVILTSSGNTLTFNTSNATQFIKQGSSYTIQTHVK
jgi:heat shock protein HtpX